MNFVDPSGLDPQDPPPITYNDPNTGQPTPVPGISASVTIPYSQVFGPGSALGGDSHAQLLLVNFLNFDGPQDPYDGIMRDAPQNDA